MKGTSRKFGNLETGYGNLPENKGSVGRGFQATAK